MVISWDGMVLNNLQSLFIEGGGNSQKAWHSSRIGIQFGNGKTPLKGTKRSIMQFYLSVKRDMMKRLEGNHIGI